MNQTTNRRSWLVILSVFVLPLHLFGDDVGWGNLTMRFVYDGDPPKLKPLRVAGEEHGFGEDIPDESLVVNEKNRGIANIAVFLLPPENEAVRVHSSYDDTADAKITLAMRRGRFEPHFMLMRTSQTMFQVNKDKVGHRAAIHFIRNPPM